MIKPDILFLQEMCNIRTDIFNDYGTQYYDKKKHNCRNKR